MDYDLNIYVEDGELVVELVDNSSLITLARGSIPLDELKEELDGTD